MLRQILGLCVYRWESGDIAPPCAWCGAHCAFVGDTARGCVDTAMQAKFTCCEEVLLQPRLIYQCDADIRKDLFSNVVLSGGTTIFQWIFLRVRSPCVRNGLLQFQHGGLWSRASHVCREPSRAVGLHPLCKFVPLYRSGSGLPRLFAPLTFAVPVSRLSCVHDRNRNSKRKQAFGLSSWLRHADFFARRDLAGRAQRHAHVAGDADWSIFVETP